MSEKNYYDVFPKMIPADQVSEIRIIPRYGHAAFQRSDTELEVKVMPVDGLYENEDWRYGEEEPKPQSPNPLRSFALDDTGSLCVRAFFAGEQEHHIRVVLSSKSNPDAQKINFRFNVYSLNDDLLSLRPYKGDFHIHTNQSDGREDPCYVAARYRQMGFDFISISDHRKYHPSLHVMDYWKGLHNGFRLYPGEEVHSPGNRVHIINFGSSFSVNELAYSDENAYRAAVAERVALLPTSIPEHNRFTVAASEWVFDQIRKGGGLCMFCHPYWQHWFNDIHESVADDLFARRKFDIFEVLGGYHTNQWRSNNYQVARYYDEIARGNKFPVAGVSDSHGTDVDELAGWYYTVVLAKSSDLPDLINSMRNGRCAAVQQIRTEVPHVIGEVRLVKYISFLVQEYFPLHKQICEPEGALMIAAMAGDTDARSMLDAGGDRVARFRELSYAQKSAQNGADTGESL